MLVANAVYFKGAWRHQFPKNQSFTGNFYLINDDDILTVNVPYMTMEESFYFVESQNFDAKLLRLPYKVRDQFMMKFIHISARLECIIHFLNHTRKFAGISFVIKVDNFFYREDVIP